MSDAVIAARSLLGWKLVNMLPDGMTSGYIIETEAYDMFDAASHAYGGERIRNSSLFRKGGTVYVYFTYGMHYCFNIVTGAEGHGQGVLIRALQPDSGIDLMKTRRRVEYERSLCNGPAKLVQAMGITIEDNGITLGRGSIKLTRGFVPEDITQTTRVGISKNTDKLWRFYVTGNPLVSKK